jgi:putative peptidoglycan binding protein/D-glucuronyl C5-epimerase-like protein
VLVLVAALVAGTSWLGSDSSPDKSAAGRAEILPAAGVELAKSLRPGSRGDAVRALQEGLAALGYEIGADGVYGQGTAGAVAAFQADHGLPADGVLGTETSAALGAVVAESLEEQAAPIRNGLTAASQAGSIQGADASRFRAMLARSLDAAAELQPARALYLAVVLRDVATQAAAYDRPRALALLGEIDANVRFLRRHPIPAGRTDTHDAAGITYRFFPDHGFQFHPLAAFAHLNSLVTAGKRTEAERLARALVERAVPSGPALTWEYYFSVNGGPTLWTSALAQAAAADALARTGRLLADPSLSQAAAGAYQAIRDPLSRPLGGGVWVREYGFSDIAILNAQLQTIVSLSRYADITGDAGAREFVARLSTAAQNLLPDFDTGCWSRYSLGGQPASLDYHRYHVDLLEELARSAGGTAWSTTATRWASYLGSGCPP